MWLSEPPNEPAWNGSGTSEWPMMCARSIGRRARRAIQAVNRADERYSASVKPAGSSVIPSCSIPIEPSFTLGFPECQAMSERCTICTIAPLRATM